MQYNKNATVPPGIKSCHKTPEKIVKNRLFVQVSILTESHLTFILLNGLICLHGVLD